MSRAAAERTLYEDVWTPPEYRRWSPGGEAIPRFLRLAEAIPPAHIIDWGCGTGRAGRVLADQGFRVTLVDQTWAAVEVEGLPFVPHCLWQPWPNVRGDVGFCCDVLEHIPTELTALTCARLLQGARVLYLEVATEPDSMGALVGQTLHKTVRPFVWWRDLLREVGTLRHGVDLMTRAAFVVEA